MSRQFRTDARLLKQDQTLNIIAKVARSKKLHPSKFKRPETQTRHQNHHEPSRPTNEQAHVLESILATEKTRVTMRANDEFKIQTLEEKQRQSTLAYERSLEKGNFFTPHLRALTNVGYDPVRRQYAIILIDKGTVLYQSQNPVKIIDPDATTPAVPAKFTNKVLELEHDGWQLVSGTKEMLILERLVNPRQSSRLLAKKLAVMLTTAVVGLTGLIYMGDYMFGS